MWKEGRKERRKEGRTEGRKGGREEGRKGERVGGSWHVINSCLQIYGVQNTFTYFSCLFLTSTLYSWGGRYDYYPHFKTFKFNYMK